MKKTKKFFFLSMIFLTLPLSSCVDNNGTSIDNNDKELQYNIVETKNFKLKVDENSKATIIKAKDSMEYINLDFSQMEELSNFNIVEIGPYAFASCQQLTSVVIPSSIIRLGEYSFTCCYNLKSVFINEGVIELGNGVFDGCGEIKEFSVPNSLKNINDNFSNGIETAMPSNMTSYPYYIENGYKYLGNENNPYLILCSVYTESTSIILNTKTKFVCKGAVSNSSISTNFRKYQLHNDVEDFRIYGANYDFSSLKEYKDGYYLGSKDNPYMVLIKVKDNKTEKFVINKKCEIIADNAFKDCSKLSKIDIPKSVKRIGNTAFENCVSLSNINLPNSLISIGYGAFINCDTLKEITIPNSLTSINNYLFSNCDLLENIKIPNSINYIGKEAFANCDNLKEIYIPNNVDYIEENAFESCDNLKNIRLPEIK